MLCTSIAVSSNAVALAKAFTRAYMFVTTTLSKGRQVPTVETHVATHSTKNKIKHSGCICQKNKLKANLSFQRSSSKHFTQQAAAYCARSTSKQNFAATSCLAKQRPFDKGTFCKAKHPLTRASVTAAHL
jgi:hypothetical protein